MQLSIDHQKPDLLPILLNQSPAAEKSDLHFRTDHLAQDLRGRSVRGGTVTLAAQTLRFLLGLGSTAVLARLLVPDDFGLIGMVTAVTGFVALFKDLGLSTATIQRDQVSHDQVSTLFWVNVALAVAAGMVVAALAPGIAWFFGKPELTGITLALSIGFLFGGLAVQHQALLRRQMRLTALAALSVVSMLVGIAVAIFAAVLGAGYWALVYQQVAMSVADAAGVWVVCRWRPGLPCRRSGIRSLLAFGGHLTGFNIVNYFARNLDNVLIGKFWGPEALGFYAKSYGLLLLPINQINAPISSVAIPALSRLQNDPDRYRAYYLKAIGVVAAFGMPLVAFLFVAADQVVLAVLGPQWTATVPIFRALAPAAFLGTFNVATGWVFISLGQTDRQFRWGILSSILTVAAFFVGLPWGALGIAVGLSTVRCLWRWPTIVYCFRNAPLEPSDLLRVLAPPALASWIAACVLFALDLSVGPSLPLPVALALDVVVYGTAYLLTLGLFAGGRDILRQSRGFARDLVSRSAVDALGHPAPSEPA